MGRIIAVLLVSLVACQSAYGGDAVLAAEDTLYLTAGIRFGLSEPPFYLSGTYRKDSDDLAKVSGVEISVSDLGNWLIGSGFERFRTTYDVGRLDTLVFSKDRFSAWYLYLTLGVRTPIHSGGQAKIGAQVDVGTFWSDSHSQRNVAAIRSKLIITSPLYHSVTIQVEAGWLTAHSDGVNVYSGWSGYDSHYSVVPYSVDFSGPIVSAMISFYGPLAPH